jgi:AraC-like DNA-binding protein
MAIETFVTTTSDPEAVRRSVDRVDSRAEYPSPDQDPGVEWTLSLATAGRIGADRIEHTGTVRSVVPPVPLLVVTTTLGGIRRLVVGHDELHLTPGTVVRSSATETVHAESTDFSGTLIRIPRGEVDRVAGERFGVAAGVLRFDGLSPVSQAAARQWRRLDAFLQHEIRSPRSLLAHPVLEQQFLDLIAATVLSVFPNTTLREAPEQSERAGARTVKRAVDFIEAHASEPVTLTAIADAAAISPRALQLAFRRHTALTPMQYLRMVRLEQAHRELLAADPDEGLTVAAVATRAGFGRASRFSTFYRQRYGVSAQETLHT